jgi:predicted RNA-binding protein YlqC (UPF0109 family)
MQDLLEYVVKSLVSTPDAVKIDEARDGGAVNLTLTVAPADMGVIIGRSGQTIKAIRRLLITRAMAENLKVNVLLADDSPKE